MRTLINNFRKLILGVTVILLCNTANAVSPLEITSVNIDFDTSQIFIHGVNFDNGNNLEINLSDVGEINSFDVTATLIVASFPMGVLPDGNYLLTVTSGGGSVRYDEIAITVGAVGPQGDVGPEGEQGIPGNDGADGDMGLQGEQGPQGIQGVVGGQGPQGELGPIAPQGIQGDIGPTGAQGMPGNDGADGATGPQGEQGPQGNPGADGGQGVQGERGLIGPQGAQGDTGPAGSQGDQGMPGSAGVDGVDGAAGIQGEQGLQGDKGPTGLPGMNGMDGPAGTDGTDGATGAQGSTGPRGDTGPPGPTGPQGPAGNEPQFGGPVIGVAQIGDLEGDSQLSTFAGYFNVHSVAFNAIARDTGGSQSSGSGIPHLGDIILTIRDQFEMPNINKAAVSVTHFPDIPIKLLVSGHGGPQILMELDLKDVFITSVRNLPPNSDGTQFVQIGLNAASSSFMTPGKSQFLFDQINGPPSGSAVNCSFPMPLRFILDGSGTSTSMGTPITNYSSGVSVSFSEASGGRVNAFPFLDTLSISAGLIGETVCLLDHLYHGTPVPSVEIETYEFLDRFPVPIATVTLSDAFVRDVVVESDSGGGISVNSSFSYEQIGWKTREIMQDGTLGGENSTSCSASGNTCN